MKREIKFRGKRLDNGEWVYGDLVQSTNEYNMGTAIWPIESSVLCNMHEVDPKTVGQFTGLHDKNGREIWEGDICKDNEFIMQVVWNENMASFGLSRTEWAFMHYFNEASNPENCEVIGNIHDNPELLK